MLKKYPVYTTLPVTDYARARAFYKEKLGLTPTKPDGDLFECGGGTGFLISSMGFKPGGHTQMSFSVDDIGAVVKHLKSKGVVFALISRGRGFKDSEGDMIGIGQLL
jgi:catechol 2,3-dioxygenase-like lactoylglutathione lyase family enzyme